MSDAPTLPQTVSNPATRHSSPAWLWALAGLCLASLLLSFALWSKLSNMQEALARQSADATAAALEGRTLAKASQDSVKDLSSRLTLLDTRLSEVALQRGQLDELMQNLSRSRDENLVVDIESALRLAQQQASLTGSLEPLNAALKSSEQRLARAAQPRLSSLQRAIAKDIDRVKAANVADTPSLLIKLDELVRLADEIPLANSVSAMSAATTSKSTAAKTTPPSSGTQEVSPATGILAQAPEWLRQAANSMRSELTRLVRVSRVDTPEAALISPEQSFFIRENYKLKLLNARLALLARQFDVCKSDTQAARALIQKFFDVNSKNAVQALELFNQLQAQLKVAEQPRIDDSLAALTALAAGVSVSTPSK
jgi:uroporphyrin-III C-methyltransferase